MRRYLGKLLEWFKTLFQKLTRSRVQKLRYTPLTKKSPETKLEQSVGEASSLTGKVETPNEQVKSPSSPSIEINASQKPSNYPPMPHRELLNTAQLGQKRPYIKCRTDELERIANSEWNNPNILMAIHHELQFRTRKKAQTLLVRISARLVNLKENKTFAWSTTTTKVNVGSQNISRGVFKYEEGLLKLYGYKVGANGLPENQRRRILDDIFLHSLPSIDNVSYPYVETSTQIVGEVPSGIGGNCPENSGECDWFYPLAQNRSQNIALYHKILRHGCHAARVILFSVSCLFCGRQITGSKLRKTRFGVREHAQTADLTS